MVKINYEDQKKDIWYILSDGKFRKSVSEETEGAQKREYETSDGKKGFKYELVARSITGTICFLSLFEGEFGKNIQIELSPDEEEKKSIPVIISLSVNSSFGEDFLKKLPNIEVGQEITFNPYSFKNDAGKMLRGISLLQKDKKIESAYQKKENGKWVNLNNFPSPVGDTNKFDNDDWKSYFIAVRKFLIEELQKYPSYKDTKKINDIENIKL